MDMPRTREGQQITGGEIDRLMAKSQQLRARELSRLISACARAIGKWVANAGIEAPQGDHRRPRHQMPGW